MTYPTNNVLNHPMRRNFWRVLLSLGFLASLTGLSHAQARFSYSANGSEVTDAKTGLVWQRCSSGQRWSGSTCTGTAASYTHEEALTYAKSQTNWRLPNVKELSSLVDRTVTMPSIDSAAFPATYASSYWSASPDVGNATVSAWYVSFDYGSVRSTYRSSGLKVRLVR